MSYFTGQTVVPVNEFSVHHDSTTQSGSQRDNHEIFHAFRPAVHHFPDSRGFRVIRDKGGYVELSYK